jgi:hypothetical protein
MKRQKSGIIRPRRYMVNPGMRFVKTGQGRAGLDASDRFVRGWSVMVGMGRSAIFGNAQTIL